MLWNYIVWDKNGESMQAEDDTEDPSVDPDAPKFVGGSFTATPSMLTEDSDMDILWGKTVTLNISNMTREALITGTMPSVEVTSDATSINDVMALFNGAEVKIDNAAYEITNDGTDSVLTFSMKDGEFATAETDYDSLFVVLEDEEGTSYDVFDIETITALEPVETEEPNTPEPPLPGADEEPTAEDLEELDGVIEAAELLTSTTVDTDEENVPVGEKWVTQATMDVLKESLEVANNIRSLEGVTKDVVLDAIDELRDAIDAFSAAIQTGIKEEPETPVEPGEDLPTADQFESLDDLIATAEELTDIVISTDGSDVDKEALWTTREAMEALNAAIDVAQEMRENEEATGAQIESAIADLNDALETFNDNVQFGTKEDEQPPVIEDPDEDKPTEEQLEALDAAVTTAEELKNTLVDTDAENVEKDTQWVTQETMDALTDAYDAAYAVLMNEESTAEQVVNATTAMNEAIEAFNEAIQLGTKEETVDPEPDDDEPTQERLEALRSAITDAEALKDTLVDTDAENVGEGEEWVTEETMTALTNAIADAKYALDDENATGESIEDAIEAIVSAINDFNAAKQEGTKTETVDPEEPEEPGTEVEPEE